MIFSCFHLRKSLGKNPAFFGCQPLQRPTFRSSNILHSKLINKIKPGTINERRIVTKPNANTFEVMINHDLAIQGAKELGCSVINIGGTDLINGTVCISVVPLSSSAIRFWARKRPNFWSFRLLSGPAHCLATAPFHAWRNISGVRESILLPIFHTSSTYAPAQFHLY